MHIEHHDQSDGSQYMQDRLVVTLHLPWEIGVEQPWGGDPDEVLDWRPGVQRPGFFRSLHCVSPVDSTAKKVSVSTSTPCPYCSRWFLNPFALKLHAEQTHGVVAVFCDS